jgi:predicted nucleic acid-binding Zn ribbon protein
MAQNKERVKRQINAGGVIDKGKAYAFTDSKRV